MILVDTEPIVALINDRDDHHQECKQLLERLAGPLLVPTTVATEACILLERRRGSRAEQLFLEDLRVGHFTLIESLSVDLHRVADLVKQYSNLPLGTVDASVIALAERLQITKVATLDKRDFSTVQPAHVPAFTLLPGHIGMQGPRGSVPGYIKGNAVPQDPRVRHRPTGPLIHATAGRTVSVSTGDFSGTLDTVRGLR